MWPISYSGFLLAAGVADELPDGSILHFDKALLYDIGIAWVNIAILTGIVALLLYKPVKKYMAERSERIAGQFEHAHTDMEKAGRLKEEYEALIRDIEKERESILQHAHQKALERSDQIIAQARREADSIHKRTLDDLRIEQENVMDEMKQQMVEISMMMAGRFVEVSMDRQTQDRYIEEAMAHLEDGLWRNS